MNYVTEQVQSIFAEKQEWLSFLYLCQNKDEIRNDWFKQLKSNVNALALKSLPDEWSFSSWGIWDFQWFIKKFTNESLSLWFRGWNDSYALSLWSSKNFFDNEKVYNLLQESKYSLIRATFDRIDDVFASNDENHFIEIGNFSFEEESTNGRLDIDSLAWYANYKTCEFAQQIIAKVNKFIQNPDITKMFIEINEQSAIPQK